MHIEKGIRSCFPKQGGRGYYALSTLGYNQDKAILDTSKRRGKSLLSLTQPLKRPETLILKAFLQDIPLSHTSMKAQIVKSGKSFEPTLFYSPQTTDSISSNIVNNTVKAIEIIYAGSGAYKLEGKSFYFKGKSLTGFELALPSNILYRRDFQIPSLSFIRETRTVLEESILVHLTSWNSGRINVCPLIAYGGYHQAGLPLHQIDQSFARLSSTSRRYTKLVIKSLNQWKEKGIIPPDGGVLNGLQFLYPDTLTSGDFLSLGANIDEGHVLIQLKSESENFIYRSVSYVQKDPQGSTFEVIFIPN